MKKKYVIIYKDYRSPFASGSVSTISCGEKRKNKMNKFLVAILAAGTAAAVGYVAAQALKDKNAGSDYDDDDYDDFDNFDTDESIDFEINDNSVKEAAEDAVEDIKDKAEDVAEDIKDAAEDIVDDIKD